jgi:hypothetical protein
MIASKTRTLLAFHPRAVRQQRASGIVKWRRCAADQHILAGARIESAGQPFAAVIVGGRDNDFVYCCFWHEPYMELKRVS